jgi:aminoglycoside phosphotransferase (APT) family kinase protein
MGEENEPRDDPSSVATTAGSLGSRPPREALDWALEALGPGVRLRRVTALSGRWLAVHALDVEDASGVRQRVVLRRWARPGWEESDPDFTPAREAAVLSRLAATPLPTPRLLALDADGSVSGLPSTLVTYLEGEPRERRATLAAADIAALGETLVEIHAFDAGLRAVAPDFVPFYEPAESMIPPSSRNPALWRAAIGLAASPPPSGRETFLHRDYHPGNIVWMGGRISGILDWLGASWGAPAADLGHLRVNLAADHGVAEADWATQAYLAAGGQLDDQRYWDVRMLLDWLPDLDPEYASGPGLERLERYLETLLRGG